MSAALPPSFPKSSSSVSTFSPISFLLRLDSTLDFDSEAAEQFDTWKTPSVYVRGFAISGQRRSFISFSLILSWARERNFFHCMLGTCPDKEGGGLGLEGEKSSLDLPVPPFSLLPFPIYWCQATFFLIPPNVITPNPSTPKMHAKMEAKTTPFFRSKKDLFSVYT